MHSIDGEAYLTNREAAERTEDQGDQPVTIKEDTIAAPTHRPIVNRMTTATLRHVESGERVELHLNDGQRLHLKRTDADAGSPHAFVVLNGQAVSADVLGDIAAGLDRPSITLTHGEPLRDQLAAPRQPDECASEEVTSDAPTEGSEDAG